MKTFHFLSGLPRSGSTVLSSILNQNPEVYVTPTSPMLDILISNQNSWHELPSVKANPFPEQLTNLTKAMIHASWEHRSEPIVIDKNRGWCKNMPASSILFEKDIKIVITTRDIPSIMASWLVLIRNNKNSYMQEVLKQKGLEYSDKNIMSEMWFNMVKDCVEGISQARKDASNRLLEINYDDLVDYPEIQLGKITRFLGLSEFNYDLNNIKNDNIDDDMVAWGLVGMHQIRNVLKKSPTDPKEILGEELYDIFSNLER
jgi:sulfotransferase